MTGKAMRRMRMTVAIGILGVPLSATSAAVADHGPYQGQTYITSSEGELLGGLAGWHGVRGGKITAWGDGLAALPSYSAPYSLMQDRDMRYCQLGAENIGTEPSYEIDENGDIGSHQQPKTGYLMNGTGEDWKGTMHICFSTGGHAAWPVTLTVT